MTYLATLLLTFALIALVVWLLTRVRTPRYRLHRENLIALLQGVVDGKASEHDWNVFTGLPIRHDAELEAVRRRCVEIERQEFTGGPRLFTEAGLRRIQEELDRLRGQGNQASSTT